MKKGIASRQAFVTRLLMSHRTALYGYIFACVRNHADAEDILQNVSVAVTESIEQLRSRIAGEQAATAEIRAAVQERQAHAERSALLEILARRHNRLPEVLWPLQAAAPEVGVTRLRVSPSEEGWRVDLTASARGRSSAEATDAVDALVRQLEAQLAGGRVSLSQMAYAPPASLAPGTAPDGVGLTFEISFTVPDPEEPQG